MWACFSNNTYRTRLAMSHALFGSPSGLSALEKCPAKVAFGKDIPEPPTSAYAEEGTAFHNVMEEVLLSY